MRSFRKLLLNIIFRILGRMAKQLGKENEVSGKQGNKARWGRGDQRSLVIDMRESGDVRRRKGRGAAAAAAAAVGGGSQIAEEMVRNGRGSGGEVRGGECKQREERNRLNRFRRFI